VQSLRTGERTTIIEGGSDARYLQSGHIVYAHSGVLFAVPFDAERLRVLGGPVPVLEGVSSAYAAATGTAQFSVSRTGSLVYIPGPGTTTGTERELAFIDRKGAMELLKARPAPYEHPRVSPDGTRVAVDTDDGKNANVWIYELSGTTSVRQLTFGARNKYPVWAPDGKRVAFQSDREGDLAIFWQLADGTGTPERLTRSENDTAHVPESWSSDGRTLSFDVAKRASEHALWTLSLPDRKTAPFDDVQHRGNAPIASTFSPDGRWLAYTWNGSEPTGVFVQPFPATGAKYLVAASALHPMWSPDGKELFVAARGRFASVKVLAQPAFSVGNPSPLQIQIDRLREGGGGGSRERDITPDGKRFIGVVTANTQPDSSNGRIQAVLNRIQVVLNWTEELNQRVPTR